MKPKYVSLTFGQLNLTVSTSNCSILLDLITTMFDTYKKSFEMLDTLDIKLFGSKGDGS